MKYLQKFSDENLLAETQVIVKKEREATLELLECLEEVERRMLYAKLGYSSLWDFCVKYLGLCESSTQLRISAMRLGRQVSEVKGALAEGSISLSNVAKLGSFFKNEKKKGRVYSEDRQRQTVETMKGLSQSQCEKKLFELSPDFKVSQTEGLKPVAEDQNLLRVVLNSKTVDQLKLLQSRLAHKLPHASYADLIEFLVEEQLAHLEKKMGTKAKAKANTNAKITTNTNTNKDTKMKLKKGDFTSAEKATEIVHEGDCQKTESLELPETKNLSPAQQPIKSRRKAIRSDVQRELWKRSEGRCEFIAPDGRRCSSTYALEIDHELSHALGGSDEIRNLSYKCRTHNQLHAKQTFEFMDHYLPRLKEKEHML